LLLIFLHAADFLKEDQAIVRRKKNSVHIGAAPKLFFAESPNSIEFRHLLGYGKGGGIKKKTKKH
jgi:hypothetical protein